LRRAIEKFDSLDTMRISGLSLDQMRAALAVAETGSFSAAARRLNRKQSAVSFAVASLERQLGVSLFARANGQPPATTEVGQLLLVEMEAVVRRSDEIRKQAKAAAAGLENELAIVIDSLYPVRTFAALLDGFAALFPTVALRIDIESMGAVQRSVLDERYTLGIAGSLPHLPPGLIGDAIGDVVRIPVASPRHPLAATDGEGVPMPSRMLLDHIQIAVSDRSELTRGRDFTVYTGRTWRVSDLSTKHELLLAGLGWGYMPEHLIAKDLASGALCEVQVEGLRERNRVAMLVMRRRDRALGPASRWVLARLMRPRGGEYDVDNCKALPPQ
jgi:DNA-binding transcriptional LysR family regulator